VFEHKTVLFVRIPAEPHIIYMRTFALSDSLNFVRAAIQFGYKFDVNIMTCDINIALDRAKEREKTTKRHVPETLIQRHNAVLKLIPDIISIADKYFIYENSNDGSFSTLKNSSIRSVMGASLKI
jgi:predicted ABC-type ATPase